MCAGVAACAFMTVVNGTYYMFNPHSCDVMIFQNDKGAVLLLYFQAWEIISISAHACNTMTCNTIKGLAIYDTKLLSISAVHYYFCKTRPKVLYQHILQ